jgi:hypothetical protein
MKAPITPRQWELLSAYLDGKLSGKDLDLIQAQLYTSPELKKALSEIKQLKRILRSMPVKRVRRNFTLTAAQAQPGRRSIFVPVFRFASLAASLALIALLAIEFLPGLFNLSAAAPKASEAPMLMASAAEQQPTELPPVIIWNGYVPNSTGTGNMVGAEGKGGGGGGGIVSGITAITPTPAPSISSEIVPVTPPEPLGVQPPISPTPAPTSTSVERTLPTEAPPSADQAQKSANGPFLGIQPTEVQGQIATVPASAAVQEQPSATQLRFSLLNYIELGLAILAIGFIVVAFFLRKRS